MSLQQIVNHFKTITYHKYLVMKGCFKLGLYYQGIMHDLSKYSPAEFFVGAKFYQGTRSPNNAEREKYGHSKAWMHHKGRNKHHYEYWVDYHAPDGKMLPVEMPAKYVAEMFVDRVAASKVYNKERYKDSDSIDYYLKGNTAQFLHENTAKLLEKLLRMLAEKGEDKTYSYIKKYVLKK